jgi:hypothetical protein
MENQIPMPVKELNTQNANDLAAWHSIQTDLKRVITWLEALIDGLKKAEKAGQPPDPALEPLWVAALVFYARCFEGGLRISLDPAIYKDLNGEPLEAHKYYIDIRSKRIAHSVNAYEQYKTGMVVEEKDGQLEVKGVTPMLMSHAYPTVEGSTTLCELSKVACNYATAQIKKLMDEVDSEAKALSQDDLRKAKTVRFTAPGPAQAGKKRSL